MTKRSIESNRYIFLIGSHINCDNRVEALRRALASITLCKPDHIYISYSVFNIYKTNCDLGYDKANLSQNNRIKFEEIWTKEMIEKEIPYTILYQPESKYQFEHFNILKDYVQDDDIVSFSDDDDLTDKSKIEVLRKHFTDKNVNIIRFKADNFAIDDFTHTDDVNYCKSEIWKYYYFRYSLRGWLFKDYFDNYEKYSYNRETFEQMVKNSQCLADYVFAMWIDNHHKKTLKDIDDVLYYQRHTYDIKRGYTETPDIN